MKGKDPTSRLLSPAPTTAVHSPVASLTALLKTLGSLDAECPFNRLEIFRLKLYSVLRTLRGLPSVADRTSAFMALPSGPLDGLLCAFNSSSNNFALATPDGRVRTYDTGKHLGAGTAAAPAAAVTFGRTAAFAPTRLKGGSWLL